MVAESGTILLATSTNIRHGLLTVHPSCPYRNCLLKYSVENIFDNVPILALDLSCYHWRTSPARTDCLQTQETELAWCFLDNSNHR